MALTYVGGTTSFSDGSSPYSVSLTSLTGGIGSSPQEGDLVVVVTGWASTSDGTPGISSAGWTTIGEYYQSDVRDANLAVAYKIMGASPDTSVNVYGYGSTDYGSVTAVHVWRGVDPTTPMDATPTVASGSNAAHPDSPSITAAATNAVILSVGLGTGDTTPQNFTAPTGYSNAVQSKVDAGVMSAIAVIASYASGPGTFNPPAWTGGESTINDSWVALSIVLRPYAHSASPSKSPSRSPSASPSKSPSRSPSLSPSASASPSKSPSRSPSRSPSASRSASPSRSPSRSPSTSPSASPSAGFWPVCQYGFEDWTGDADTTPAYIFSTNDAGEWADHLASSIVVYNPARAYSGSYYFHRQFNTTLTDALLGGIATSINDYGYVGLGGIYSTTSGDKFALAEEITSKIVSIRFRFAVTDDWKTQTGMDLCAFFRLLGNQAATDPDTASAFVFLENGNNSDTAFYLWDPSSPTNFDQHYAGVDLQDGDWHSFGIEIIRNNDINAANNISIKVWWDDWDMTGTPTATKTITCSTFGDAFDYFQVAADWSGSAPTTLMGLDLDTFEIWNGPLFAGEASESPSASPSLSPSASVSPSRSPSASPSWSPSRSPSISPSGSPSASPSWSPSRSPSTSPSMSPSVSPSASASPSMSPSRSPSMSPSRSPSASPSKSPSRSPSLSPSRSPSNSPSRSPSNSPLLSPSNSPSNSPSMSPSESPSNSPSASPSEPPIVEFIQDLIARRGIKSIGGYTARVVELSGGQIIEPTAFEPDASTHRSDFYYNAITNSLYRRIITRNQPGIIVAHWQRVSG